MGNKLHLNKNSEVNFSTENKSTAPKVVAHCISAKSLLEQTLLKQDISQDHLAKVGIDGGGGFLKVSLGVMNLQ